MLALLMITNASLAATLDVGQSGTESYSTIQSAINAAASGDIITVGPGTYLECVNTSGKDLRIVSTTGSTATTIQSCGCSNVVTIASGETVTVDGFTLLAEEDRGLYIDESTAYLYRLVVSGAGNDSLNGGGAYIDESTVVIDFSTFTGNTAYQGAHLYITGESTVEMMCNHFETGVAHFAGGVLARESSTVTDDGSYFNANAGDHDGGAFYVYDGASLSLHHSTLTNNTSEEEGGAIHISDGATLSVTDSFFEANESEGSGGAIMVTESPDAVVLSGTDFSANVSRTGDGGAVAGTAGVTIEVSDASFESNSASDGRGGGISLDLAAALVVTDSFFYTNEAAEDGGAISMINEGNLELIDSVFDQNQATVGYGGAVFFSPYHDLTHSYSSDGFTSVFDEDYHEDFVLQNGSPAFDFDASGTEFTNNLSYYSGGGLYAEFMRELHLNGSEFVGNTAAFSGSGFYGGGAYLYHSSSVRVSQNYFCGNEAYSGAGIMSFYANRAGYEVDEWNNNIFSDNKASSAGGGFFLTNHYHNEFHNNTIVGNEADFCGGAGVFHFTFSSFVNNIVAYTTDGDGLLADDGGYSNFYSDFFYNAWFLNMSNHRIGDFDFSTTTNGNMEIDPEFVSYSADGNCYNDNLTLAPTSPLIDAGYPVYYDTDGSTSDMGAYGGPGSALADADGDGFFADAMGLAGGDCDDSDASINPDAEEIWGDGIDQDCDGNDVYGGDADGDGFGGPGFGDEDCDDNDAAINPDAEEIWYDGIDSDCDGASDFDADGDGHDSMDHGGTDCDDDDAAVNPDAPEMWYDGIDSNCDGADDYDADGDGFADSIYGGTDCDDSDASINPDATETPFDGIDQDCNGTDGSMVTSDLVSGCSTMGEGRALAPWLLGLLGLAVGRRRQDKA